MESLCSLRSTAFTRESTKCWHALNQTASWQHTCSHVQAHTGVSCRQERWNFASPSLLPWPRTLWLFLVPTSQEMFCWLKIQLKIILWISHFPVSFTNSPDQVKTGISAVGRKTFKVCCSRQRVVWKVVVEESHLRWGAHTSHISSKNEAPSYLFFKTDFC